MKIGVFLTVRLGSTRLKRKHLLPVAGKPILSFLVRRVASAFRAEMAAEAVLMAVATTPEPENKELEAFSAWGARVFHGPKENIPLRLLEAARHFDVEGVVSVDGDDMLVSTAALRLTAGALARGADYVRTANLPLGMNVAGYSRAFLEESLRGHADEILETGWGRVFDASRAETLEVPVSQSPPELRLTLDYEDDYAFFKALMEGLVETLGEEAAVAASDDRIIALAMERELWKLNASKHEEYWRNFNAVMNQEKERSGGAS